MWGEARYWFSPARCGFAAWCEARLDIDL